MSESNGVRPERPPIATAAAIRRLWIGFAAVLVLTLAAGLLVPAHDGVKGSFGFGAWFGFASCVALVLLSRLAGLFLKRPEAFYRDEDWS